MTRAITILIFSSLGVLALLGCGRAKPAPTSTTCPPDAAPLSTTDVLTGVAALGDYTTDTPGLRRKLTLADLPAPNATDPVNKGSKIVGRPDGALPRVPDGFTVSLFAKDPHSRRLVHFRPDVPDVDAVAHVAFGERLTARVEERNTGGDRREKPVVRLPVHRREGQVRRRPAPPHGEHVFLSRRRGAFDVGAGQRIEDAFAK